MRVCRMNILTNKCNKSTECWAVSPLHSHSLTLISCYPAQGEGGNVTMECGHQGKLGVTDISNGVSSRADKYYL